MKKFLSLTVALAMTVAMVPSTAFAKTNMRVSKIVTAESDDILYTGGDVESSGASEKTRVAPYLTLTVDGDLKSTEQSFRLKLTNAEWLSEDKVSFEKDAESEITVRNGSKDFIGAEGGGGGGDTAYEKALDALKTLLKGFENADNTAKEFAEADFKTAVETGFAESGSKLYLGDTGTDAIGTNDEVTTYVMKWATADVAKAARLANDTDYTDEWKDVLTEIGNYHTAAKAHKVAELAFVDADLTDAKKVISDFNDQIAGDGVSVGTTIDTDAVHNYVMAQIEAGTSLSDVKAAIDELNTDYDAADAEVKALFPQDTDYNYYADLATFTTDLIAEAYYTKTVTVQARAAAMKPAYNLMVRALKAFNESIGAGASVSLDAKETVDKYKELNGNMGQFRDYLAGLTTAQQDQVIDSVKKVIDAEAETPATQTVAGVNGSVTIDRVTDTLVMITINTKEALTDDTEVTIPLWTKLTGGETATVEVEPRDSEFTTDSKTFARISEGSTTAFIDGTKNFYDGDTMKTLHIDEVSAKTFETGKDVRVKLSSGFKWGVSTDTLKTDGAKYITLFNGGALLIDYSTMEVDGDEITFQFTGGQSTNPATLKLANLIVKEDGADFGTTAKVTVSGAGISKDTIEIGTYADFGITLTAESKALPVIYSGSFDDDNETLKVTFEETVQNSWIPTRKTVFSLPEGVKVVDLEVKKNENFKMTDTTSYSSLEDAMKDNIDGNEVTIPAQTVETNKGKKAKFDVIFTITADPAFTGDVELTVGGPGVGTELSKTIATVNSPLTVTSSVNEVKIDYRNVAVNSITITEAEAGLWEKGDKITLEVEEMQFESGIKAEIVSGDMKLEKLDGDNVEVNKKDGTVTIQVKSTSSTTPAEIKIDGIQLYLNRSLPAGDYKLNIVTTGDKITKPEDGKKDKDLLFANYFKEDGKEWDTDSYKMTSFETDSVTVLNDFVKVVTAGRDQDDSTFTTKIVVPVGSNTITAGTTEITIDSPAYINADGYTMLPVRAVIDALNGVAVVRWDDATKTCTISFGSRIFAMTVGSKTMNMNGVATALLAAPEIRNERIFLPLRDLGYALGLTDSKIAWDSATNTATLN